ncbi:beta-lactamase/transpeptidase-like protein [Aspergillus avenaceus]|uniref:Beta-lactamase/transpeptidase-like protein n=1 Tax=Aspergillus avenaceus TaxID=36643 RepID=A0A5N6TYV3_ASPAV|nr:beta-lactamase/transpeptidase-like protein [Aspergillus avenaceus]
MVSLRSNRASQLIKLLPFLLFTPVSSEAACPLGTPIFPPPRNLSSDVVKTASHNLTQAIESALITGVSNLSPLPINTTTFAVQVFSAHTQDSIYEYLYTSPTYSPAPGHGAPNATFDSVYRIASISKMFTVLTLLANDGYAHWASPITQFIPELESIARSQNSRIQWSEITIGDLAGQLSGVPHDYGAGDLAGMYGNEEMQAMGFPALSAKDIPTCSQGEGVNSGNPCDREAFLRGITSEHPTFAPGTTPAYSNAAYQLLRYAIENITDEAFPTLVENSIIKPLKLNHTTVSKPTDPSTGIIPVNETVSLWGFNQGDGDAFGGMYSSANDLSALGRAILQSLRDDSALNISSTITRHWLKPLSHTASLKASVGAPWEIYRFELPNRGSHGVDVYTKSGDLGAYADIIAVVPEWDIGFTITAADLPTDPHQNVWRLADLIMDRLFPAFDTVAQQEAEATYAGTYRVSGANSTQESYLTLSTEDTKPGLQVTEWMSNGVNFLKTLETLSGFEDVAVRLYPTGIEERGPANSTKLYFRNVFDYSASVQSKGLISSSCMSWMNVEAFRIGNVGVDEWVFTVPVDGKAKIAEPRLLRAEFHRS